MGSDMSLFIMIVASIILSYFFTMTIILRKNFTHHRNKLYQALLMGAWMGVIMILLMRHYDKMTVGVLIVLFIAVGLLSYFIREQTAIDQDQSLLGMIEH